MSETTWLVLRCTNCGQCSGHRLAKGRCPHCGESFSREVEVVATVSSTDALQMEVALANTPEPLRAELRERMERGLKRSAREPDTSANALFGMLRQVVNDVGELTADAVLGVLQRKGVEQSVDEVMAQAEGEGLVLRCGPGRWMLLE